ncbi:MAG: hypothetical protein K0R62_1504, partial [Nonomuraea muscovyensis]|nr:hypothetical protein [Nonomuraea muscovyensis]
KVIPTMLQKAATGQASVDEATTEAAASVKTALGSS